MNTRMNNLFDAIAVGYLLLRNVYDLIPSHCAEGTPGNTGHNRGDNNGRG